MIDHVTLIFIHLFRVIHEAYQFLTEKMKKRSGRPMKDNLTGGRRKSAGVARLSAATSKPEEVEVDVNDGKARQRAMSLY